MYEWLGHVHIESFEKRVAVCLLLIFPLACGPFSRPHRALRVVALLLVGLVILVVGATPKKSAAEIAAGDAKLSARPRNYALVFQIVLMVFLGVGGLLSALGLLAFQVVRNSYARPIQAMGKNS